MAAVDDPVKIHDPALLQGSWVLITGVNGFIASHTADQLLAAGYKVRGTVRSLEKARWLYDVFAPYGEDNFTLAEVQDISSDGAFEQAIKGVAGVIHTASPVDFNPDPEKVISPTISATMSLLKSTAASPDAKRFVFTSSSAAVYTPIPNQPGKVTADDWNEEAVKDAWAPPPYEPSRGFQVYAASKAQAEQAVWKWCREQGKSERLDLVVNSVLPNANIGTVLDPKRQGFRSTAGAFKRMWDGDLEGHTAIIMPQYYIDVQDDARLHMAALLLNDVQNERIFAFAGVFDYNTELAAFRKADPHRKLPDDVKDPPKHLVKVPNERAEELLKRVGRKGWTSFDDSVALMVKSYKQAE